ncbi:WD40 repeat domain-containing protein [Nonomuraea insulae]|uniref:WD40 repeat domain-containing protein n=1 Tax=Nonomuraea insulae TaxID=1616787 RepID=A0ABW1CG69_9ACTN
MTATTSGQRQRTVGKIKVLAGMVEGSDKIVLWDWVTGTQLTTLPGRADRLSLNTKGDTLAACDRQKVTLWNIPQHAQITSFPCGPLGAAIAFSPDGTRLAVGGIDNTTIIVWNVARHTKVATLSMPPSPDAPSEGAGPSGDRLQP